MIENLKTTLLLVAFMLFCMVTQAQNVTVQGTVTDSQDEPIIGATLRVKKSKAGAVTDLDGKFKLENVRQGSEIEVSSIGFVSQTVKASAQTMTIKLTEDKKLLDEVVVVGYGTLKKGNMSGAVSSIKVDELPTAGSSSLGEMLRGRASGANITSSSAAPGGGINSSGLPIAYTGNQSAKALVILRFSLLFFRSSLKLRK